MSSGVSAVVGLVGATIGFLLGEKHGSSSKTCPACPDCGKPQAAPRVARKPRGPGWKQDADAVLDTTKQSFALAKEIGPTSWGFDIGTPPAAPKAP